MRGFPSTGFKTFPGHRVLPILACMMPSIIFYLFISLFFPHFIGFFHEPLCYFFIISILFPVICNYFSDRIDHILHIAIAHLGEERDSDDAFKYLFGMREHSASHSKFFLVITM